MSTLKPLQWGLLLLIAGAGLYALFGQPSAPVRAGILAAIYGAAACAYAVMAWQKQENRGLNVLFAAVFLLLAVGQANMLWGG